MLFTIIRKEVVGNVLSLRFAVTFALFFTLVLVSIFVLTNDYQSRLRLFEASRLTHRERLGEQRAGTGLGEGPLATNR